MSRTPPSRLTIEKKRFTLGATGSIRLLRPHVTSFRSLRMAASISPLDCLRCSLRRRQSHLLSGEHLSPGRLPLSKQSRAAPAAVARPGVPASRRERQAGSFRFAIRHRSSTSSRCTAGADRNGQRLHLSLVDAAGVTLGVRWRTRRTWRPARCPLGSGPATRANLLPCREGSATRGDGGKGSDCAARSFPLKRSCSGKAREESRML